MADKQSRIGRLRARYGWLDHVIRANESYGEHYGNHYAAAITYFSVLSLIPILMVAFAIAGIVLAGNTHLLGELQSAITKSMPGALGTTLHDVVNEAITARGAVGIVGLVIALYSGIGWMGNLRDALTAQWGQERRKLPLLPTMLRDLLALIGLGLALAVSIAITVAGTGMGAYLIRLAGLADDGWARFSLVVLTVLLSLLANWLVFLWVIARLPRERVGVGSAVRGALVAAIGFEALKQLATVLLKSAVHSPTGAVFGSIIGLLVFANLVSRFLLMATAWTATAAENQTARPIPAPPPAVIRPIVVTRQGMTPGAAAGLMVAVGLTGWALRRRR
ncbi:MAG TPA: inner membrane protein YhjD [Pseudonocardiaceae bacterium]|nr:inner membrane protein YhjD [Pseudonocardiaceae bacterium]